MEQNQNLPPRNLFTSLMPGVVFFALGALVFGGLGFAVGWAVYGFDALTGFMAEDAPTADGLNAMRLLQAGYALGAFLAAGLLANKFLGFSNLKLLNVNLSVPQWALSFVLPLSALPAVMFLGWANENIPFPSAFEHWREMLLAHDEDGIEMMMRLLAQSSTADFIINLLLIAVLPAVAEEFFFRGYLQRVLQGRWNVHLAVWITAIIFSLFHLQYAGFLPRLVLGAVLGYVFVWSKSLWPSIILHFINNASAVFAVYYYGPEMMSQDPAEFAGETSFFVSSIFSFLLMAFLLFTFYKFSKRSTSLKTPVQ